MPIARFAANCPLRSREIEGSLGFMVERSPRPDEQSKVPADETLWTAGEMGRPLPDRLRRGLEALSGFDMSDVRVCFDSPWPAWVGARAFAYGTVIHLQPGAEDAVAHEAWHVVQQKQGRVRATGTLRFDDSRLGVVGLNDDDELEHEADAMGCLAERIALRRDGRRATPPLRSTTIRQPMAQRTVTVGTTRYTSSQTDFESFCKHVLRALGEKLGDRTPELFPATVMAQILADFVMDDETFADDAALLREIGIRNVGYRVEASMRELMVANERLMRKRIDQKNRLLADAREQWSRDQKVPYPDRIYKDQKALSTAVDKIEQEGKTGFLSWVNASYLPQTVRLPMARWVTNRAIEEPLAMNCWEGTLYPLVKAGLAGKGYILWANWTHKAVRPAWKPTDEQTPTPRFLPEVVKIRDYYWSVSAVPLNTADRRPQPTGWNDTECACIPAGVTIPKGRLVILNFGAHVAVSTGRSYLIASEKARTRFGRLRGHGILELDKPDMESGEVRTIHETTIEDLVSMGAVYLKHILIAPFPCIADPFSEEWQDEVRDTTPPSVQEAIQAFLDKHSTKIKQERAKQKGLDDRAIERTKSAMRRVEETSTRFETLAKTLKTQETAAAKEQERITGKWQNLAMKSSGVKAAIAGFEPSKEEGYVKVPITYAYDAVDLYHGLVVFEQKT